MVLSFVDYDMIMRYFGGGIGHLGNSTWHQVDSELPNTQPEELDSEEEMEIRNDGINDTSIPGELEDITMNYKMENSKDEQGSGSDSLELDSDKDSGSDSDEDSNEGTITDPEDSDDNGYGSF